MDSQIMILTRKQTAERLNVSERTVDRLCATDSGLKKLRLSARRVGFADSNIEEYIRRIATSAA
jgi:predicted DNA-binding transcriptional regulator AlpA